MLSGLVFGVFVDDMGIVVIDVCVLIVVFVDMLLFVNGLFVIW